MWDIPKDPANDGRFSDEELDAFIETVAGGVVRRRMSVPAVIALELAKPVSFLGYSSMLAFGPILEMMFDPQKIEKPTCILADRERIESLLKAIEKLENDGSGNDEPGKEMPGKEVPGKEGPDKEGESGGH